MASASFVMEHFRACHKILLCIDLKIFCMQQLESRFNFDNERVQDFAEKIIFYPADCHFAMGGEILGLLLK